ncbi:MAG: hypothetical protein PF481_02260 [Bacteroidales bacterium]|jgi:pectate lyase|nr:hypothetical protein [Bacteroidales bacterium]
MKFILSFLFFIIASLVVAQPNFGITGYATENGGTTGGQGGTTVTVSTLSDLKNYAQSDNKYIIMVDGTISNGTSGDMIDVGSNTSIIGMGNTAFLKGIGLQIKNNSNIIIQNIKMTFVGLSNPLVVNQGDLISIHTSGTNIWIDHCEFYSEDPNVQTNKDKYDGLLDIKQQTGYITISWCYFHDHWKCGLVGAADDDLWDQRLVTYHHNYYKNIKYRMPMYRGATGHFFNNYLTKVEDASEIRAGTCVRVEKNYYENFHYAIYTPSDAKGYTERIDNYLDAAQPRAFPGNCTANIPYDYSAVLTTNAQDVKSIVLQYSGVGQIGDDCNGDPQGSAYIDQCGVCVGGNTGVTPCVVDCNGDQDGMATLDECGICSGGNTGVQACPGAIQGEDFCGADGVLETDNAGFIGDGYLNLLNANGSSALWNIVSATAQTASIDIRYANGGTAARGMNILVNGSVQVALQGNVTGAWTNWISETVSLNLLQGVNSIELTATDAGGGPNIDAFIFNSNGLTNSGCIVDCNGILGGFARLDDCNVCSGGNTGVTPCVVVTQTISLNKGWNMIGCPLEGSTNIEDALSSVWQYIEAVKGMDTFYIQTQPAPLNLLTQLIWGEGYFIKVSSDCTLTW